MLHGEVATRVGTLRSIAVMTGDHSDGRFVAPRSRFFHCEPGVFKVAKFMFRLSSADTAMVNTRCKQKHREDQEETR